MSFYQYFSLTILLHRVIFCNYFLYFQYQNDQEIHKVDVIITIIFVSLNCFSRFELAISMVYNETILNSTRA